MDAVEYFKKKSRMTKDCALDCEDCLLSFKNTGYDIGCGIFEEHYPEKAVEIIDKWTKEHPVKTRQSEFLKMFPKAVVDRNDVLTVSPCEVNSDYGSGDNKKYRCVDIRCDECRKKYWLEEIE